jgi:hypothetical protein
MSPPTSLHFPHRRNDDGTYESMCTTCLATVARRGNESELLEFELDHECDPVRLFARGGSSAWEQQGV